MQLKNNKPNEKKPPRQENAESAEQKQMLNNKLSLNEYIYQQKHAHTTNNNSSNSNTNNNNTNNNNSSSNTNNNSGNNSSSNQASNTTLSLDFARWFLFCQHCRHGGHTRCLSDWFSTGDSQGSISEEVRTRRTVCGVNGCNCQCVLY